MSTPDFRNVDGAVLLSGIGRRRTSNQDACGAAHGGLVLALADGMGGHPKGAEASRGALDAALRFVLETLHHASMLPGVTSVEETLLLRHAFMRAQQEVMRLREPGMTLMPGTTLTLARLGRRPDGGPCVRAAWSGDTRAYLLRGLQGARRYGSALVRLTTDDHRDPILPNVITRAIGMDAFAPNIVERSDLEPGDAVALFSDGIWGVVPRFETVAASLWPGDPSRLARTLYDAACAAGGPDNGTVVVRMVS